MGGMSKEEEASPRRGSLKKGRNGNKKPLSHTKGYFLPEQHNQRNVGLECLQLALLKLTLLL